MLMVTKKRPAATPSVDWGERDKKKYKRHEGISRKKLTGEFQGQSECEVDKMVGRLKRKGFLGSNDFNLVGSLDSHSSVP